MHIMHSGHLPGHIRDAFLDALQAYADWDGTGPEPVVDFEVGTIPISIAAKKVWNCTDTLPSDAWDVVEDECLDAKRRTYASAARAMVQAMA